MQARFSPEFFRQNRERLRSYNVDNTPIVITANGVVQRNSDVVFPFRQDSSFWYLTGVEQPDVILVIDNSQEYLVIPERDEIIKTFDGADDIAKLSQISGIKDVFEEKQGWQILRKRLEKAKQVATLSASPAYVNRHGFYSNPARNRLIDRLKASNQDLELIDLRQQLMQMRVIKQPEELVAIQEAIDDTASALTKVYERREHYGFEYEIEADITAAFRSKGNGHAFSPIIASGKNACTIHHVNNDGVVAKDGLLVLDVGEEVSLYAADITRTYAIGRQTKRQQAVFDAVVDVQQFAFGQLRPGVFMKEYEQKIEQYMGEKLQELGLIKKISKEQVRKYYPHATSHFLGLDTHDVGEYDKPLAPGMVLTVEPGIYIPEEGIGVRIEDDVLITKAGLKNLSKKLPVEL